jgi:cysteine desulfurase
MLPLYFDFAASTPIDPCVAKAMMDALTLPQLQGNPSSSTHSYGWAAQEQIELARATVAALIGARSREIVFTSGATEANNLVIQGVAYQARRKHPEKPIHMVTSALEHKAVLETCEQLATEGVISLTIIPPNAAGLISAEQVDKALNEHTLLVSIMHVNNELGNINPIAEIGDVCKSANVLFHVDAAQSVGKLPVDMRTLNVDFLTFSAHKLYGPKGAGVLCSKKTAIRDIRPIFYGGNQERSVKPGTLATHQIMGLAKACEVQMNRFHEHEEHVKNMQALFLCKMQEADIRFSINSNMPACYPGIINVCIHDIESDHLLMGLPEVAFSTGSACNSTEKSGSHVLIAIGIESRVNAADVRISFGWPTTEHEVTRLVTLLKKTVDKFKLRAA